MNAAGEIAGAGPVHACTMFGAPGHDYHSCPQCKARFELRLQKLGRAGEGTMIEIADVKEALERHTGEQGGITAARLVAEITGSLSPSPSAERKLRDIIAHLRHDGLPVCGHPVTGYYLAESSEELELTCRFLRKRALHSLVQEAQLRKLALPDLLGQIALEMNAA